MKAASERLGRIGRGQTHVLALAAVLLAGACGGRSALDPFHGHGARAAPVLVVENRHWADMTISVRRGGHAVRLGMVTTNSRHRFTIPADASAAGMSVTLLADPVGSGEVYESPIVTLVEGDTYVWTLGVNLQQSTLVRR